MIGHGQGYVRILFNQQYLGNPSNMPITAGSKPPTKSDGKLNVFVSPTL